MLGVFRCEGDRIEIDQSLAKKYLDEKKIEQHPDFPGRKIYRMLNNPRKNRAPSSVNPYRAYQWQSYL